MSELMIAVSVRVSVATGVGGGAAVFVKSVQLCLLGEAVVFDGGSWCLSGGDQPKRSNGVRSKRRVLW